MTISHVIRWEFEAWKAWGGDGRKDGRTDVWRFTPVSYKTSALWGRCPKSNSSKAMIVIKILSNIVKTSGRWVSGCMIAFIQISNFYGITIKKENIN